MATYTGTSGNDSIVGSSSSDTIHGLDGNDTLGGGNGNDSILGGAGDDWLLGGNGNDTLEGGAGSDTLDGGAGIDWASYKSSSAAVAVYAGGGLYLSNYGDAAVDDLINIENLEGSAHNDTLSGVSGVDNVILGGAGADTMYADGLYSYSDTGGSDTLSYVGSNAAVTVNLTTGAASGGHAQGDVFYGFENLIGSSYGDTLTGDGDVNYLQGRAGADTLDGGAGSDWATYDNVTSSTGVNVNLATGTGAGGEANGDVLSNIENLRGTKNADTLTGDGGDNILIGGAGADTIDGGGGNDWASYEFATARVNVDLTTGTGSLGEANGDVLSNIENLRGTAYNDTLTGDGNDNILEGGNGADSLIGGGGFDVASYQFAAAGLRASLSAPGTNTGAAAGDSYSGIEGLRGSEFDDTIIGSAGGDFLHGGAGADTLSGGDGDDTLEGGLGSDTLDGGAGFDWASYRSSSAAVSVYARGGLYLSNYGDAAVDELISIEALEGSAHNDTLSGSAGFDDLIMGGAGADTMYADGLASTADTGGSDTLSYATSATGVQVDLSTGTGTGGDAQGDAFYGFENIIGSAYADTLTGDADNNVLRGGNGADTLTGGAGQDWAVYDEAADGNGITVDLATGTGVGGIANGDVLSGIEHVRGTQYADTITGDALDNILIGGLGADTLSGGGGNDWVSYEYATAAITADLSTGSGSAGEATGDVYTDIENLRGTIFADTLTGNNQDNILEGGDGADTLSGGGGHDQASYAGASMGVQADLSAPGTNTGAAAGDVYFSIEGLDGSNFDDVLTGDSSNNWLRGFAGADALYGGDGNDTLEGGLGSDILDGGNGIDWASYRGSSAAVAVYAGGGLYYSNYGDAAVDNLFNIENLEGSAFNDTLAGVSGVDNVIIGGAGADVMHADGLYDYADTGGSDTLSYTTSLAGVNVNLSTGTGTGGDAQGDTFYGFENVLGSAFADTITGDTDTNLMTGNGGADTFVFLDGFGDDTIIDFSVSGAGKDIIDLSSVTGVSSMTDLTFTQVGSDTQIDISGHGSISILNTLVGDFETSHFVF